MLEFVLSLSDAVHCRLILSPLGEVVRLARATANPRTFSRGIQSAWLRRNRSSLEHLPHRTDVRLLLALLALRSDYYPDFLTPTPLAFPIEFEAEIDAVRATPRAQVAEEIELTLAGAADVDPKVAALLRADDAGTPPRRRNRGHVVGSRSTSLGAAR